MYPIQFSKQQAEEVMAAITEGRDIPAPLEGWTAHAMLQVAGSMLFAAMSHGRPVSDFISIESTNGNTTSAALSDDVHMAADIYSDLTMLVCEGTYDERFRPEVQAIVLRDGDERTFKVIDGDL